VNRPARVVAALVAIASGAASLQAQATQRYVAFGDSITRGYLDDAGKGGYPARLAKLLTTAETTVTVENKGKDGETTAEGLSRIATISGAAADTLLLMEGTNDVFARVSSETIASNLISINRRARQQGFGRVVLATILPIGRTTSGSLIDESKAASDEIRQAAYESNLAQPDPNQAFRDVDDVFSKLYSSDNIHPNADGYDKLAQVFADTLLDNDVQAPAVGFVSPAHLSVDVSPSAVLSAVAFDALSGVDAATATLTLDGVAIPTTVGGDARRTTLQSKPGGLTGKRILGIDVRDRATPPNRRITDLAEFTVRGTKFLPGDIDESGRVDGADLVRLGLAFGARVSDSRYDSAADLDSNGRVDGNDLAVLSSNFGESSF